MKLEKDIILDAINYSRRKNPNNTVLTVSESILAHQYIHQGIALPNKTVLKINRISETIKKTNWQREVTRYNSELQLERLNTENGKWEIIK